MPAGKSHHQTPSLDGRVTCETLIQSDHGRKSADSVTNQKEAPLHVRTNSSERLLRKLPSIIGLPRVQSLETGTYSFRKSSRRRPPRFFPGNSRRDGRVVLPETEPTSPKVSCMGVVKNSKSRPSRKKQTGNFDGSVGGGGGWWKKWLEICCRGNKAVNVAEAADKVSEELVANARLAAELGHSEGFAPPSLGEMKRFSSYRKSGSLERSLDFDAEFEPVRHRRFETDRDISDMPSTSDRRNSAAEEELDHSEGVARPSLRAMERFGSYRTSASLSWDRSFDFEDDIEPVQQRMRFEMDLHVSDKASSSQRRNSAAALPYI